jgi:hypothetical protein
VERYGGLIKNPRPGNAALVATGLKSLIIIRRIDAGYRMQDTGCRIQDAGYRIRT